MASLTRQSLAPMMQSEMAEGSSWTKAARGEAGTTLATRDSHLRRASRRRYALSITLALALEACLGLGLMLASGKRWEAETGMGRPLWIDLGGPTIGEGHAPSQGAGVAEKSGPAPLPKQAAAIAQSKTPGTVVAASSAGPSPAQSAQAAARVDAATATKLSADRSPRAAISSESQSPVATIAGAGTDAETGGGGAPAEASISQSDDRASGGTGPESRGGASVSSRLATELAAFIESHKNYPEAARRRGTEGTARLAISIDAAGRLLTVRSVESSGSALLDAAAEALLRSAFPLEEGPGERLEIAIAVRYVLARP